MSSASPAPPRRTDRVSDLPGAMEYHRTISIADIRLIAEEGVFGV
jgi:hypothetical protein